MSNDIYEVSQSRQYRLCVWETNKGPALGYVRWGIQAWDNDLGWYWVEKHNTPTYLDVALRQARATLAQYDAGELLPPGSGL